MQKSNDSLKDCFENEKKLLSKQITMRQLDTGCLVWSAHSFRMQRNWTFWQNGLYDLDEDYFTCDLTCGESIEKKQVHLHVTKKYQNQSSTNPGHCKEEA